MMNKQKFNQVTILLLTLGISIIFFFMIKGFMMAIFMAALFSGILYPIYQRLTKFFKDKTSPAALGTIFFFVLCMLIPFAGFLIIVIRQAINAGTTVKPIVDQIMSDPDALVNDLEQFPVIHQFFPDQEKLANTIQDVISSVGNFVIHGLQDFSAGTANFIFLLFIFLFTLYYFLVYGKEYLKLILFYLPLKDEEEHQLLVRFTRVTKATLKGTFLIGTIQGSIGAVAMWSVGLTNVVFWGLIMIILSIIPAVGPALVWAPAAALLFMQGQTVSAIILAVIGIVVIGNIDNLLRPRLVGKDAQMPDLMILFGTLGGLSMFGVAGVIVGPIIAAMFTSLWHIYGKVFTNYLYPSQIDNIHREFRGNEEVEIDVKVKISEKDDAIDHEEIDQPPTDEALPESEEP